MEEITEIDRFIYLNFRCFFTLAYHVNDGWWIGLWRRWQWIRNKLHLQLFSCRLCMTRYQQLDVSRNLYHRKYKCIVHVVRFQFSWFVYEGRHHIEYHIYLRLRPVNRNEMRKVIIKYKNKCQYTDHTKASSKQIPLMNQLMPKYDAQVRWPSCPTHSVSEIR